MKKITLQQLKEARSKVKTLEDEKNRAEGALKTVIETMEKEFGVGSKAKAELRIKEMREKAKELEERALNALEELEEVLENE